MGGFGGILSRRMCTRRFVDRGIEIQNQKLFKLALNSIWSFLCDLCLIWKEYDRHTRKSKLLLGAYFFTSDFEYSLTFTYKHDNCTELCGSWCTGADIGIDSVA